MLENQILEFVEKRRAVFLADIAREFSIENKTAHDLAKLLQKQEKVFIEDKGVAKLVIARSGGYSNAS